jgi:hypothetical protein
LLTSCHSLYSVLNYGDEAGQARPSDAQDDQSLKWATHRVTLYWLDRVAYPGDASVNTLGVIRRKLEITTYAMHGWGSLIALINFVSVGVSVPDSSRRTPRT